MGAQPAPEPIVGKYYRMDLEVWENNCDVGGSFTQYNQCYGPINTGFAWAPSCAYTNGNFKATYISGPYDNENCT